MAKKKQNTCETCKYKDGLFCTHCENKGIIVKYRSETPVFFKTCIELNPNGDCENYAQFSEK